MRKLKQSEVKAYREEMLKKQNGKCAFCGEDCEKPCLDHAHLPPWKHKVRGVVCNWCNIAIGKLENARVRTGTSWETFENSFPDVHHYVWHYSNKLPWSDIGYMKMLTGIHLKESQRLLNLANCMQPNSGTC